MRRYLFSIVLVVVFIGKAIGVNDDTYYADYPNKSGFELRYTENTKKIDEFQLLLSLDNAWINLKELLQPYSLYNYNRSGFYITKDLERAGNKFKILEGDISSYPYYFTYALEDAKISCVLHKTQIGNELFYCSIPPNPKDMALAKGMSGAKVQVFIKEKNKIYSCTFMVSFLDDLVIGSICNGNPKYAAYMSKGGLTIGYAASPEDRKKPFSSSSSSSSSSSRH